jgi:hypothetical protein
MPTMRSARPSAATISVLEAKIVTIRCGGAGTVTVRSNASRTAIGSATTMELVAHGSSAKTAAKKNGRITITIAPAARR